MSPHLPSIFDSIRSRASLLAAGFALLLPLATRAADSSSFSGVYDKTPAFDPMVFFNGHTHSWGVLEDANGKGTEIIKTETTGHLVKGELQVEQDLYFGDKPRQHRSWRLHRIDAHHFEGTASDLIGILHGETRGNLFMWSFTAMTKPGHPLYNVQMTQRMYLMPDGRTMINRDTIRKFGILLAEATEQFRKD